MFIMSEGDRAIVNSNFVRYFYLVNRQDNAVLYASFPGDEKGARLGTYKDMKEAEDALGKLYAALTLGENCFYMPESRYYNEEHIVKDARVKRRGGS